MVKQNYRINKNVDRCPVCSVEYRAYSDLIFIKCRNCGLWIRKNSDKVEDLYLNGWLKPLDNLNITGGTTPLLAKNYIKELLISLELKSLIGKTILDFGGGRGEMSMALQFEGATVLSVDPYSFNQLREQGINAVKSLEEFEGKYTFNGVIAIDVFEHLLTPWEELGRIKKLLSSGGWLYLSTPNAKGLNARLNRDRWREVINPSHLLLFTPASMERMLYKVGFKRFRRLHWRVDYSQKKSIQIKDWLLRASKLDGVLRYIVYV